LQVRRCGQTGEVLTELAVSLLVEAAGSQGRHVDEERTRRYAQVLDDLPPVVVFDTEEGLLLADGYHRLAAAVQLGRATLPAELRQGTRRDALAYALARASADRGVTPEQARAGIARWSLSQHEPRRPTS
jgi:hypothetical protein